MTEASTTSQSQGAMRIGILLTYPKLEAKKEELVTYKKGCKVRPWVEEAEPAHIATRSHRRDKRVTNHPISKFGLPTDVATGCYIKHVHKKQGVEVDFILPHEISMKRLKGNDINFLLIYDLLEAFHTDKTPGKSTYKSLRSCLQKAGNIYPPLEYQELIYSKISYYNYLKQHDVSIAPTLTMTAQEYKKLGHDAAAEKVLGAIKTEKWGNFVAKPVYGMESKGLKFFEATHEQSFKNFLAKSFNKYPGMVFQKEIKNFGYVESCPELRMYFVGDKYKYSVSCMAQRYAVRLPKSEGGKLDAPMGKLKKITHGILKKLPTIRMPNGVRLPRLLTRLDMGYLIDGKFKPFVNEVEFVPSLYPEDVKKVLMDKDMGEQMVKIARLYVAASKRQQRAMPRSKGKGGGVKPSTVRVRKSVVKRKMK